MKAREAEELQACLPTHQTLGQTKTVGRARFQTENKIVNKQRLEKG